MTWAKLIADLVAAPAGGRELDTLIFKAMDLCPKRFNPWPFVDGSHWDEVIPHYTTDFEDAVSWVPEGCAVELCQSCPNRADDDGWDAFVFERPRDRETDPIGISELVKSNPAHALSIANAKAHQAMAGEP